LYAANIDLGTDNFELVQILAPVADVPDLEPPRQQNQQRNTETSSNLPNRQVLIRNINQTQQVPTEISTTPSMQPTLPESGRFTNIQTAPNSDGTGGPTQSTRPIGVGSGASSEMENAEVTKATEPPPIVKAEPKRTTIKSEGVINGKATFLPNPPYPKPAEMIGAYGIVNVQVTIDESGKVISSKAVSGHPLLRGTAESAAWKAKFSPTYLSKVPVKVTGVIVFNFKKS
ncbi:MAG: energy transducer TonB, partial [Acidobacteriota bacterium]